jgi:hypothetical protein
MSTDSEYALSKALSKLEVVLSIGAETSWMK